MNKLFKLLKVIALGPLGLCMGLLVTLEGIQGSGKSTAAVGLAVEENERTGKAIYSNDHLNHPDYHHFDTATFVEKVVGEELEDMILLTDEMYQMADSRSSGTKLNKLWSYFVVQTRKRGVDMYICTHHLDHIDLRLRRAVDIRGSCRYYPESPCKKCRCKRCGGQRYLVDGSICPDCHGIGGTGEFHGQPCDRCKGYGEWGIVKVFFLDRRIRRKYLGRLLLNLIVGKGLTFF